MTDTPPGPGSGAEELKKEAVLEDLREEYRERTGEELPDHVLENYDDFLAVGPTIEDIEKAMDRGREAAPEEYTEREVNRMLKTVLAATLVFGFLGGLLLGLAIGLSSYSALLAMFSVIVGVVLNEVVRWAST